MIETPEQRRAGMAQAQAAADKTAEHYKWLHAQQRKRRKAELARTPGRRKLVRYLRDMRQHEQFQCDPKMMREWERGAAHFACILGIITGRECYRLDEWLRKPTEVKRGR